ncbi:MAG: hypothetical protein PVG22_15075 [Chromatiales bacterium]
MFSKDSRYLQARPFCFDADEPVSFSGVRPRPIGPASGVIEHTLRAWDRLDQLAAYYYNDPRKWWRILDANPELLFGGDCVGEAHAGKVILIPASEEAGA